MRNDVTETTSRPAEITPVQVAIIGTGTGDGGAPLTTGTVGSTPDSQPNIVLTVVTPAAAILIRFLNNYLTTLVGLLAAGSLTSAGNQLLGAGDFLHLVRTCAALSVAGPGLALGKDLVTVLGRLESRYPLLTGSI